MVVQIAGATVYLEEELLAVAASKGPIDGKIAGNLLLVLLDLGYLQFHTGGQGYEDAEYYELCDPRLKTYQVGSPDTIPQTAIAELSCPWQRRAPLWSPSD